MRRAPRTSHVVCAAHCAAVRGALAALEQCRVLGREALRRLQLLQPRLQRLQRVCVWCVAVSGAAQRGERRLHLASQALRVLLRRDAQLFRGHAQDGRVHATRVQSGGGGSCCQKTVALTLVRLPHHAAPRHTAHAAHTFVQTTTLAPLRLPPRREITQVGGENGVSRATCRPAQESRDEFTALNLVLAQRAREKPAPPAGAAEGHAPARPLSPHKSACAPLVCGADAAGSYRAAVDDAPRWRSAPSAAARPPTVTVRPLAPPLSPPLIDGTGRCAAAATQRSRGTHGGAAQCCAQPARSSAALVHKDSGAYSGRGGQPAQPAAWALR